MFNKQAKIDRFWNWFSKNQQSYFNRLDHPKTQDQLVREIWAALRKVHPKLVFYFGQIRENGTREFIISAEGRKSIFPLVDLLVMAAPKFENWEFISFRQRCPGEDLEIQFGNVLMKYSDIYFRHNDGEYGDIGIELHVRNFNKKKSYYGAVYLLLDSLLGEYDVTMGINWIEWVKLDESNMATLEPITRLRTLVDTKKSFEESLSFEVL